MRGTYKRGIGLCMSETKKTTLPEAQSRLLQALARRVGVDQLAEALGVTRTVLTGALAELMLRQASAKALQAGLEALRTSPGRQEYLSKLEARYRPMHVFLAQCCETAPEASVGALLLFQAWERWCEPKGVASRTRAVFEQRLLDAAPGVSAVRASPTSKQVAAYAGVRLKS